jgi:hypothetical protein
LKRFIEYAVNILWQAVDTLIYKYTGMRYATFEQLYQHSGILLKVPATIMQLCVMCSKLMLHLTTSCAHPHMIGTHDKLRSCGVACCYALVYATLYVASAQGFETLVSLFFLVLRIFFGM